MDDSLSNECLSDDPAADLSFPGPSNENTAIKLDEVCMDEAEIDHISAIEKLPASEEITHDSMKFSFVKYGSDYVCISPNCFDEILERFRLIGRKSSIRTVNIDAPVFYDYNQVRLVYEKGCANFYLYSDKEVPGSVQLKSIPYGEKKTKDDKELEQLAKTIAVGRAQKRMKKEDPTIDAKRLKLIEPAREDVVVELNMLKEKLALKKSLATDFLGPNDWLIPTAAADFLPLDPQSGTNYHVMHDLWSRGFYVTDGFKFGCDYLVYDGQPGVVHSTYMCIIKHQTNSLQVADTMLLSRLARSVKKSILLAIPGPEKTLFLQMTQWDELSCGREVEKKTRRELELEYLAAEKVEEEEQERPISYDDMTV